MPKLRLLKWLTATLTSLLGVLLFASVSFAGTTPKISSVKYAVGSDKLIVQFNVPVWGDEDLGSAITNADFTYTDSNGAGASALSAAATHTAGETWAILDLDANMVSGDSGDLLRANANSIFYVGGPLANDDVAFTADSTGPDITAVSSASNGTNAFFVITFDEPIYSSAAQGTSYATADFAYADGDAANATDFTAVTVTADKLHVLVEMDATIAAGDSDETITVVADSIYDYHGNAAAVDGTPAELGTDGATLTMTVEAKIGNDKALLTFVDGAGNVTPVYNAGTCTGATDLDAGDFTYTNTNASGATAEGGVAGTLSDTPYIIYDLDANVATADLTNGSADEVVPGATSVYNCSGTAAANTGVDMDDTTDPVLISIIKTLSANGLNSLVLQYSEGIQTSTLSSAGSSALSTTTLGDMTSACNSVGLGSFASGDYTYSTGQNLVALATVTKTQDSVSVIYGYSGVITGGDTQCSGVFTPSSSGVVYDLHSSANTIEAASTHSTITTTNSWVLGPVASTDSTSPAKPTGVTATVNADGDVVLNWTNPSDSDLDRVKIFRGVSPLPIDAGTPIASLSEGETSFTDTNVSEGDVITYVLKAYDNSNNASPATEELEITVTAGASAGSSDDTDTTTDETATDDSTDDSSTTDDGGSNDNDSSAAVTYEEEQQAVKDAGIVTTEFEKGTNKCEALVMMARVMNWTVDMDVTEDGFNDTPGWCKPYAAVAKDLGVVNGRSEGVLGATDEVSRFEVAVMLAKALGYTDEELKAAAEAGNPYSDEVAEWALGAVNVVHDLGAMTGYPDGTFGGSKSMLKIELAVALWRAADSVEADATVEEEETTTEADTTTDTETDTTTTDTTEA